LLFREWISRLEFVTGFFDYNCTSMFDRPFNDNFSAREEEILQFWQDHRVFERSVDERKDRPLFSFYDGPPFATGLPHYGHLLAGTIKDVVPRYKTMKGYWVPRRFGWDCHGLPVENEIEKMQQLSGTASIETFGIANFNEECRKIVLRYTAEWKQTVNRIGRWVDFDHTYQTMDPTFMESVWWVFKQLWDRDLVYEGFKVMPFSAQLGTPLSNFEANLNYKEVDDPSLTVKFQCADDPSLFFLAWTTTPWTLPSNLALMVSPDITYAKVRQGSEVYILAEDRIGANFKGEDFDVIERFEGKKLEGRRYKPLFDFFRDRACSGAFRVVLEGSVSVEEGTGIVHAAPAFGEIDFFVCKRENIDLVCPVDNNGYFTREVPPYAGLLVKDADKEIIRDLKRRGAVFSQETVRHRYPFCWRSDTPLIYKAVRTWFVAVEKIKDRLMAANNKINWVPEYIKQGRFGNWLENARDWAISRNRYWGTPIPIWRSADGQCEVMGSIRDLEEKTNSKITDLHRHFIDDLSFEMHGRVFRRIPEVFDCWFESGSMPYAQNHYPFENKSITENGFPADFIAEGLDQTRGWFYTLNVLSVALFDQPAFKNVIVNGIILAEDGNKMSKRLKNYPDPEKLLNKFGADAVRLYMLQGPAVHAEDLRFSEKGVEHVLRQALIPLWNSFVFLSTYAKIYQWIPEEGSCLPTLFIDRWILALSQKTVCSVTTAMDAYRLDEAISPMFRMIDQLTNWYIRRNRSRFWADEDTPDRREAFSTLYSVLLDFVKMAAPFIPFLSEAIYRELRTAAMPESVHLCDFPHANETYDRELLKEGEAAQMAVGLGHAIRKEYKIKVRQPLAQAYLITGNAECLDALKKQEHVIADELNVKSVTFHNDESAFVQWMAKPNFPVLGKKAGKNMPQLQKVVQTLSREQLETLARGGNVSLKVNHETFILHQEDIIIERKIKENMAASNEGDLTVVLDIVLNEALIEEGLAREIINKVNTMRREMEFAVTDRIRINMKTTPRVERCFERYGSMIRNEVLAAEVIFGDTKGAFWDLNGEEALIAIHKVSL
jgi:isoleucyl-tRNA synthetase